MINKGPESIQFIIGIHYTIPNIYSIPLFYLFSLFSFILDVTNQFHI